MGMSYEDAVAALKKPEYQSLDGLRALVDQVSVDPLKSRTDATALFYSGYVGKLPAWQMAEAVAEESRGNVITIKDTPAKKFLDSQPFRTALRKITGPGAFDETLDGVAHADGTRTEGMFDIASRNLARAAKGDVQTITPNAQLGKVFSATELPELLKNPNVTRINGIDREQLNRLRDAVIASGKSHAVGDRVIFRTVNEASRSRLTGISAERTKDELRVAAVQRTEPVSRTR